MSTTIAAAAAVKGDHALLHWQAFADAPQPKLGYFMSVGWAADAEQAAAGDAAAGAHGCEVDTASLVACNYNDADAIASNLRLYRRGWAGKPEQTAFFRAVIPTEPIDFTATAEATGLPSLFTARDGDGNPKVVTRMLGPYNCNMLHRQSRAVPHIVVYSDDKRVVLQPLGEPGLALGAHPCRASHLMVVTHAAAGPITLNDMLPSSDAEVADLADRLGVLGAAYRALAENRPVAECGAVVAARAAEMGVPPTTPLRSFMAAQIAGFSEAFRAGRPGYKLLAADGADIAAAGAAAVEAALDAAFGDGALEPAACIQAPEHCSQLLAHIHGFLLRPGDELPADLRDSYVCARTLLEAKKQLGAAGGGVAAHGGGKAAALARQMGDETLVNDVETKADPATVKSTVDPKVVKNTVDPKVVKNTVDPKVAKNTVDPKVVKNSGGVAAHGGVKAGMAAACGG